MGLLDALDESIATVEAEHQDGGGPTTATLASTAAAPPASLTACFTNPPTTDAS